MTDELELTALDGTNPLGLLAALGVLQALHRAGREPTLRWSDDLVPVPLVSGASDADDLVTVLDTDRVRLQDSITLRGPGPVPVDDAKPPRGVFRSWAAAVAETLEETREDADLFAALMSEGGVDGNGNGKPTHLHFTAGQQRFLLMVRELAEKVGRDRLHEAVFGPWRQDSPLPSLSWNSQGDRLYALRAVNPSTEKRLGVPGADWLAFLGLVYFPTSLGSARDGSPVLRTSGCDGGWKRSHLRWPLWKVPLDRDTTWSLVGDQDLVGEWLTGQRAGSRRARVAQELRVRGVLRVLQAPIRRSDQGGYGSFGGASVLVEAAKAARSR
jgi:hypothetical protein